MKILIFAGGIGTRFWPMSRKSFPKQFQKIFNGKSTLELTWQRLAPDFGAENIFLQTVPEFEDLCKKELPDLNPDNIILEPSRRNNGPAVCMATQTLVEKGLTGPVSIIWADNIMEREDELVNFLKAAEALINENKDRFIFIGERPRFASNNLGWIHTGTELGRIDDQPYYKFLGWKYKPEIEECNAMFDSGEYLWNPGYFITSIEFLDNQFKTLTPELYQTVKSAYNSAEKISFDKAIIEHTDLSSAVVLKTDMGWSDPGTLYALKEALQMDELENVTKGNVFNLDSKDCLTYNLEDKKLLTTVGLEGIVIVNTKDAIIVVPKDKVKYVTDLVKKLEGEGLSAYL
jgi:mannose-1-phosphate guanylyltransferase